MVGIQTSAWKINCASVYFDTDKPVKPYLDHLKEIVAKNGSKPIIVGGDVNAKSTRWGSPSVDHRREEVCGTLGELVLHILNSGAMPTFDTVSSDHNGIVLRILQKRLKGLKVERTTRIFNT